MLNEMCIQRVYNLQNDYNVDKRLYLAEVIFGNGRTVVPNLW